MYKRVQTGKKIRLFFNDCYGTFFLYKKYSETARAFIFKISKVTF